MRKYNAFDDLYTYLVEGLILGFWALIWSIFKEQGINYESNLQIQPIFYY